MPANPYATTAVARGRAHGPVRHVPEGDDLVIYTPPEPGSLACLADLAAQWSVKSITTAKGRLTVRVDEQHWDEIIAQGGEVEPVPIPAIGAYQERARLRCRVAAPRMWVDVVATRRAA